MSNRVMLLKDEDWQALYIDGELVTEDHMLSAEDVLQALDSVLDFGWNYREHDFGYGGRAPYTLPES